MNAKAVRFARQVNRIAGTLGKRYLPPDAFEQAAIDEAKKDAPVGIEVSPVLPKPHKVKRAVKRWWASLNHATRGKARAHWQHAVRAGTIAP